MNAVTLLMPNKEPANVWMCQECHFLTTTRQDRDPQAVAERCCQPRPCGDSCGTMLAPAHVYTVCEPCRKKREQAQEFKRFEAATKLTPAEYNGPVFDRNENFYQTIDDFYDNMSDECEWHTTYTWVWCAEEVAFKPDADRMLENALQDHHEDAYDQIDANHINALHDFVKTWAAATKIFSYEQDYRRVVLINRPDPEPDVIQCLETPT